MGISPLPADRVRRQREEKNPDQIPQRKKPKLKEDAPQSPGHSTTIRDQAADWSARSRFLLLDWPSSAGMATSSAALFFLALDTCSPFGSSIKSPVPNSAETKALQRSRDRIPGLWCWHCTAGEKLVNELVSKGKDGQRGGAWLFPACGASRLSLCTLVPNACKHVSRPFSPHPWEKDDSELASSGLCWGPRAPPITSASVPSILSPLTSGGSQEALASLEAWRTAA